MHLLIVDDHAMFHSGLRLVLKEGVPDVEVWEAAAMEQAVRVTDEPLDLVLLDIQMQAVNGVEGLGLLRQRWQWMFLHRPSCASLASARPAARERKA